MELTLAVSKEQLVVVPKGCGVATNGWTSLLSPRGAGGVMQHINLSPRLRPSGRALPLQLPPPAYNLSAVAHCVHLGMLPLQPATYG